MAEIRLIQPDTGSRVKVMLFTNKFLIEESVKHIVNALPDFVFGDTAKLTEPYFHEGKNQNPFVFIVDVTDKDIDPFAFLEKLIRHVDPKQTMLITAEHLSPYLRLVKMGFLNLLKMDCSREEFAFSMKAASRGEKFFCDRILREMTDDAGKREETNNANLTDREKEILAYISKGFSAPQIADRLSLSIHTVHTHRKNLKRKLGVGKTAELVHYMMRLEM